jgi:predicted amidohydrolase YtcJ
MWTGDTARPEVEALAIGGERITAVGTSAEIAALAGESTRVVDLQGRRVVPGFNDAHWHLPARRHADLADAGSAETIVERLTAFASTLPAEAWVTGRGWGATDFADRQPHRRALDAAFPSRPVLLTDRDGQRSRPGHRRHHA